MFIPFTVKHGEDEYELSDANFIKRSPKLFVHWYYKKRQSIAVDKMYSKEAVSYICDYLNGNSNGKIPEKCKDILETALSLGCPNLLIELFESRSMLEAIDFYKYLISKGVMLEEYEQMLTKMMNERDDYLEASSLPIECLARLCRGLSTEKRIELAKSKGGQSACLLLIGINPSEICPDMMAEIGKIEGWTENKRLSEHYNNEISKMKKEILKMQDEMRMKDEAIKKKDCEKVDLIKLFLEKGADINIKTKVCLVNKSERCDHDVTIYSS